MRTPKEVHKEAADHLAEADAAGLPIDHQRIARLAVQFMEAAAAKLDAKPASAPAKKGR